MTSFNIRADLAIERAGGLFCKACLSGRTDHSADPRYCQRCYDFLTEEGKLLRVTRPGANPNWLPKAAKSPEKESIQGVPCGHNYLPTISMAPGKSSIMSTSKRGPKHKVLPEDLIVKLADQGMNSKGIAQRLNAQGIAKVSYKTVERILKGKRLIGVSA